MIPAPVRYERATDLEHALELLGAPDAKALAGGHSLLPVMKLRIARPSLVVDVSHGADVVVGRAGAVDSGWHRGSCILGPPAGGRRFVMTTVESELVRGEVAQALSGALPYVAAGGAALTIVLLLSILFLLLRAKRAAHESAQLASEELAGQLQTIGAAIASHTTARIGSRHHHPPSRRFATRTRFIARTTPSVAAVRSHARADRRPQRSHRHTRRSRTPHAHWQHRSTRAAVRDPRQWPTRTRRRSQRHRRWRVRTRARLQSHAAGSPWRARRDRDRARSSSIVPQLRCSCCCSCREKSSRLGNRSGREAHLLVSSPRCVHRCNQISDGVSMTPASPAHSVESISLVTGVCGHEARKRCRSTIARSI